MRDEQFLANALTLRVTIKSTSLRAMGVEAWSMILANHTPLVRQGARQGVPLELKPAKTSGSTGVLWIQFGVALPISRSSIVEILSVSSIKQRDFARKPIIASGATPCSR